MTSSESSQDSTAIAEFVFRLLGNMLWDESDSNLRQTKIIRLPFVYGYPNFRVPMCNETREISWSRAPL